MKKPADHSDGADRHSGQHNDPTRDVSDQLAVAARARYSPEAYIDPFALGFGETVEMYLQAAAWEAGHVSGLRSVAARLSGQWPTEDFWQVASALGFAVEKARGALDRSDLVETAKNFTVVALLWKLLREHDDEVATLSLNVQRASTVTGEEAAEKHLRALASAGELPVGRQWRDEALLNFRPITARGARRVWDRVASHYPALSSGAGKPRRRLT